MVFLEYFQTALRSMSAAQLAMVKPATFTIAEAK
jgi:hypothetical protein